MSMDINEVLEGSVKKLAIEDQTDVLTEMKKQSVFDLPEKERKNLIDFLCEVADEKVTVDYLFHVLDNEISYPSDDERVNILFSDERMISLRERMLEMLSEESDEEVQE